MYGRDEQPPLEIGVDDLAGRVEHADRPALLDVREPDEHATGILPGARLLSLGELALRIEQLLPDREISLVVYCAGGRRSAEAVRQLRQRGYRAARSLAGGIMEWRRLGLPVVAAPVADHGLSATQLERYSRQLRLPEIGVVGQRRLLDARVLCVGAGGLGSPAALYLAAAGIGCLGLVDGDAVALSNLHRQVLHTTARVGMPKTQSAARTLGELNPDVDVRLHATRLTAANVLDVMTAYDLVIDASDNFPTRYLVNDAALRLDKPVVHGAVLGFEGQVSVFTGQPCYRCLFPVEPPAGSSPSCQEAGVLGVVPGVIGTLQALEAIKWILGIGESLRGRLAIFDGLSMRFDEVAIAKDPACRYCGAGIDRRSIEPVDGGSSCPDPNTG